MAEIRMKSVFDRKADLRYARENGISLSWNRYENMLPQDGFARLGLACFDCLAGPCRLDPFSRTEERTVCGLSPDDLVYRTLMRLMGCAPAAGDSYESIVDTAASLASGYALNKGGRFKIGPGVLKADMPNACVEELLPDLLEGLSSAGINAVTVGGLVTGYDCASSLCDAEFLLLTGLVDVYVSGQKKPALPRGAAEKLHTSIVRYDCDTISAAKEAFLKRGGTRPASAIFEIEAVPMSKALELAGENAAIIGGEGSIKQTLDALALDAVRMCQKRGVSAIICGGMVPALAKYGLDNVIWCCDKAASLLSCKAELKPDVFLPGILTGFGVAEAIALGNAGYRVLTATELPLGFGELGERLGQIVRFAKADVYIQTAKGGLS